MGYKQCTSHEAASGMTGGCTCVTGDTLEQAQLRKMDALLATARVGASDHVLEVGCGWGSLALRAVQVLAR